MKMYGSDAALFNPGGKGFMPEEKLLITITYADRELTYSLFTDSNGKWIRPIIIDIKQYEGGRGTFEVKRQAGELLVGEYLRGSDAKKSIKGR